MSSATDAKDRDGVRQTRDDRKVPATDNRTAAPEPKAPDKTEPKALGKTESKAPGKPSRRTRRRRTGSAGWHYQRQLQLVEAADAPEGKRYVTFANSEPGRASHALQGLAVDGRKVSELAVSLWVKGEGVRAGAKEEQQPVLAITFYDENRAQAGLYLGRPLARYISLRKVTDRLRVPPKAREAIVRIGLAGATGESSFDDIHVEAAK